MAQKGQFILLTQVSGQIAIDTSGSTNTPDLVLQGTSWAKLNESSNWRFYFNTINSFTSYQSYFSLSHTYTYIGLYNLSLTFLSTGVTFCQTVNVTDCKFSILRKKKTLIIELIIIIF